ncbi:uncharacterized protein LY89DRAFT_782627 [Mollisia scopiformis]|uniref:Clr5 domain-containing protein n=1 Tax=Mollisia scopiformis TaxID=149040 RepID=A0A194X8C0_MOLSC|nr:uncharacterized protein LY89DRAFT_782627 [Mollisia scopiformis]KUJ16359.1 hypothetical protein LY89DRAFT_782627 [Mollisia scopiformis]
MESFSSAMSYAPGSEHAHPSGSESSQQVAVASYPPTRDDWDRHRPLIKQLYLEENKKLKEVMDIMKQHGFKATTKMYKDRITKWGLDKKNKERDMLAIVRKKRERDAIGKDTSFRVRDQPVSMEQVWNYLERKKTIRIQEGSAPLTPPEISWRTPSPIPQSAHSDHHATSTENYPSDTLPDTVVPSAAHGDGDSVIVGVHRPTTPLPLFSFSEDTAQKTLEAMYYLISDASPVNRPLSTPHILPVPERLLFSIKSYIQGSFENETWIDRSGRCINTFVHCEILSNALYTFHNYYSTAVRLADERSYDEFRRVLSKAFAIIGDILRIQHTRTLDCFLEVFLDMIQRGHLELVSLLVHHIHEMSKTILLVEHPLRQICQSLAILDKDHFRQAIIESWKCTSDGFERRLGFFHSDSLDIHLYFVSATYGPNAPLEEERLLRQIHAKFVEESWLRTPQMMRINLFSGFAMQRQRRYSEAEALGNDILLIAEDTESLMDKLDALELDALELVASSQYYKTRGSWRRRIFGMLLKWLAISLEE